MSLRSQKTQDEEIEIFPENVEEEEGFEDVPDDVVEPLPSETDDSGTYFNIEEAVKRRNQRRNSVTRSSMISVKSVALTKSSSIPPTYFGRSARSDFIHRLSSEKYKEFVNEGNRPPSIGPVDYVMVRDRRKSRFMMKHRDIAIDRPKTPRTVLINHCEKRHMTPISSLVITNRKAPRSLLLFDRGIRKAQLRPLIKSMSMMSWINTIDLGQNYIDSKTAARLIKSMQRNIHNLDLASNQIKGSRVCKAIRDAMVQEKVDLCLLNLASNKLGDEAGLILAEGLRCT